ncbi:MAG: hypothetical protein F6K28_60450, partial [Microcoleus sp. SIO2G3]|nr:hypothetical protein [Microcoleus sp. SIO2G3]
MIRLTLILLYFGLMLPLPFLAIATQAPVPPMLLSAGILAGAIALYAALSERVIVDEHQIQVAYPAWVPQIFRKGWSLPWAEIQALKPRSTGQGGLVYYLLSRSGEGY